jgi:CBS domain-containing protein
VSGTPVFVSRLIGLGLLATDGSAFGRLVDVVIGYPAAETAPPVLGFVAEVQRRRIFINANRVAELDPAGARLVSGTVDLRRFKKRAGELLVNDDLIDKRLGREIVNDVSLVLTTGALRAWSVSDVSLAATGLLRRRRTGRRAGWDVLRPMWGDLDEAAVLSAELRELHPADAATQIAAMSEDERQAVAEAMDDEDLADLLVELPEDEAVAVIEHLDRERAADVLEEMDSDDAADLLAELPYADREEMLRAMEPEESESVRRLLQYLPDTAGGLMNPDPLILSGTSTVAEALARLRDPDLPAAEAAHVFVCEAPHETPTGRYLGPVGFQRLLREPPSTPLSQCLDPVPESVTVELATIEIARRLASYDVVAVPVVDAAGRLLGAVSVDDVLDHLLPVGWRRR